MSSSSVNQPVIFERTSRFMRWLCKLFKGGSANRNVPAGRPQSLVEEDNMFRRPPLRPLVNHSRASKEKEELDRSIARSLAKDSKRPNGQRRQGTGKDEDLARSLHDNINSSSYPPPHAPSHAPWDYNARGCSYGKANQHNIIQEEVTCYMLFAEDIVLIDENNESVNNILAIKCSGCHGDIGSGNYLGCMGTFFHPECFLCHACGLQITEYEFSLSGNNSYHKSCFKELTHPKCEVCHQFIPNENDDTKRCCSCEHLESCNTRYISLGDGRSLCLECTESAIVDTGDCQQLYHAIRDFYEGMNMAIDQQVPMLFVERQALNEAIEGEKHGFHHMPETRGLCLSEEQTVTSILKRPRMGGRGLIGIRTQPQKLTRKCEVTAILVLYGLPRLLTGAILAHELMHAWLRLKGFRNLSPEVEEGICQVLSQMWLESEVMPGSRNILSTSTASSSSTWSYSKKGGKSGVENKLGEFFMHQIAHDASPAYGAGFRAANAAVNKYGLRRTLDHIRLTGSFPV